MKKLIRTTIIATIITIITILSCACAIPANAETSDNYYNKLSVVINKTRIESNTWVIDCRDKNGNIWSFLDDEGTWSKGDIANLLLYRINENEKDDEVMEVYWEGYTDNLKMFFQIMGWCQ